MAEVGIDLNSFNLRKEDRHKLDRYVSSGIVCITGGDTKNRWKIAVNILKSAINHGKTIYSTKVYDLIDAHFKDGNKSVLDNSVKANVLWLRLDFNRKHSWAVTTLLDLLAKRSNKTTIITQQHDYLNKFPLSYRKIYMKEGGNGVSKNHP